MVECAIRTRQGTKVADVAWASMERVKVIHKEADASVAPEVCVEVVSMSNTRSEMAKKRKLYFEQGAREVWECDEYGKMRFYGPVGELKRSALFPDFPARIELNIPE
jgi:Uma2 family endonuclease